LDELPPAAEPPLEQVVERHALRDWIRHAIGEPTGMGDRHVLINFLVVRQGWAPLLGS
jgi:hypothetical protein